MRDDDRTDVAQTKCECFIGDTVCAHVVAAIVAFDSLAGGRSYVVGTTPFDIVSATANVPLVQLRQLGGPSSTLIARSVPLVVHPAPLDYFATMESIMLPMKADDKFLCYAPDCKHEPYVHVGHCVLHMVSKHKAWLDGDSAVPTDVDARKLFIREQLVNKHSARAAADMTDPGDEPMSTGDE